MVTRYVEPASTSVFPHPENVDDVVVINGKELTINDIVRVARHGAKVRLSDDTNILKRVEASCDYITDAVLLV